MFPQKFPIAFFYTYNLKPDTLEQHIVLLTLLFVCAATTNHLWKYHEFSMIFSYYACDEVQFLRYLTKGRRKYIFSGNKTTDSDAIKLLNYDDVALRVTFFPREHSTSCNFAGKKGKILESFFFHCSCLIKGHQNGIKLPKAHR